MSTDTLAGAADRFVPLRTAPAARRTWGQFFLAAIVPRAYRLGLLAAAVWVLYIAGRQPPPPDNVSLADAQTFFPAAASLASGDPRLGGQTVLNAKGEPLGLLLTTSPHADDIIGYSGPSNLLIALDLEQRVLGARLLSSGDTDSHVDQVRAAPHFWAQFRGRDLAKPPEKFDAVSGSTLTSLAFAEAIERRLSGSATSLRFQEPVKWYEVRELWSTAKKHESNQPRAGWAKVWDGDGKFLGYAVRTSPYSDNTRGYQGPTESLVAVAPDGKSVVGVMIKQTYDTPSYVDRIHAEKLFLKQLAGRTIEDWSRIDFAKEGIEGVSGATQTSFAVADGIRRRFQADLAVPPAKPIPWGPLAGMATVLTGALAFAFTPLKSSRWARGVWQLALVSVFAFWLGDILSLSLFVGWARHGLPWQTGAAAIALAAVALILPWTARRQTYCQHICPHGAAQTWLGKFKRLHVTLPAALLRWLARLPAVLLAVGFVLGVYLTTFDLSVLEPFDAWVLKGTAAASAGLAVAGLIASIFIPQAYCRFGCPTGELLRLVKSGGSHDALSRRDALAGLCVALVAVGLWLPGWYRDFLARATTTPETETAAEPPAQKIAGRAFGANWSVKFRGAHDPARLQQLAAAELERIESTLSHWRPGSFTSQFNASETTLESDQPPELVALVVQAMQISRATQGKFDITVAPLVDAWGYGPSGAKTTPPDDAQLLSLLSHVGWQKLQVDAQANTLRKQDPLLQIDLGALLQGYAADQLAKVLTAAGVTECLIDVGGELVARGAWRVAIENPANDQAPLRTFVLQDRALATSGSYRSKQQLAGVPAHHLLSPSTGRPVAATATLCAVTAPTALEADAWATGLIAVGLPDALQLADQQRLAVLLLDAAGQVQANEAGKAAFEGK